MRVTGYRTLMIVGAAALSAAACTTYPDAPRYSTRADQAAPIQGPVQGPMPGPAAYPGSQPYPATQPYPGASAPTYPAEAPPPLTAPVAGIEGGSLPSVSGQPMAPAGGYQPSTPAPVSPLPVSPRPQGSAPTAGESVYVIQSGDTISGIGRRFRSPVQSLIDLNGLGPQGTISAGQRLRLPVGATDVGPDPYATGPAPVGVVVSSLGVAAPPPPPVRFPTPAPVPIPTPVSPRPAPVAPSPAPSAASANFQWPVRGEVLRRFGPVGVGERNNGVNIGASAGATVVAAGPGRVAYVGDALPGQGLTVLIVHRDGWRTVYGHLGSATVDDGDEVRAGQQIGTVGLTAGDGRPSMHFETRRMQGDDPVAVDPLTVLPR